MNRLTARQTEVLRLIATGLCYKQVAVKLNITIKTVQKHSTASYKKLGIHNFVQATHCAIHMGLVKPMEFDGIERCTLV